MMSKWQQVWHGLYNAKNSDGLMECVLTAYKMWCDDEITPDAFSLVIYKARDKFNQIKGGENE